MFSRPRIVLVAAVVVMVGLLAGAGWLVWWVGDNIGAPGPGPTGSGPCGPADSVNIQLVLADGQTVQACTRDRPACPNQTVNGSGNGQTSSVTRFALTNQLRSSSRRYIFSVVFDAPLAAEVAEQTLQLGGFVDLPGLPGAAPSGNGALSAATVEITPRDPYETNVATTSGALTIASTHGVASGRIDGSFLPVGGSPRPDRPQPSPSATSLVSITGTFECNR
jgi:hypothetical protein